MTAWLLARLWRGAGGLQWLLAGALVSTVALATVVVLLVGSLPAALDRQDERTYWTRPSDFSLLADPELNQDYAYIGTVNDRVGELAVTVVNVAQHGEGIEPPPGIDAFPEAGEVLLSPALERAVGDAALARYGLPAGMVDESALAGPGHMVAVRGVAVEDLAPVELPLLDLGEPRPQNGDPSLALLLALAGAAMVIPPLLLAHVATRAAARTRARRTATLVVAGAPRSLLRRAVLWESCIGAVLGVAAGTLLFAALRRMLAPILVEDPAPFPSDLVPPVGIVLLLVVALPVGVAVIAVRQADHATRDPLGTGVSSHEEPGMHRTVIAGALLLAATAAVMLTNLLAERQRLLLAVALGAGGLLLLAPWVSRTVGRVLRRSRRPAAMLAGGTITAAPRATARGVTTAGLAVFVATIFVVTFPGAVGAVQDDAVIDQADDVVQITSMATNQAELTRLADDIGALDGVGDVASVVTGTAAGEGSASSSVFPVWIGDCARIVAAAHLDLTSCAVDGGVLLNAAAAAVLGPAGQVDVYDLAQRDVVTTLEVPDESTPSMLTVQTDAAGTLATSARAVDAPSVLVDEREAGLDMTHFRPTLLIAGIDDPAALDRVRTLVLTADPSAQVATRESSQEGFDGQLRRYYSIMLWGGGAVLGTSAVALLLANLTTAIESARTLAVLHAVGTPHRSLRRVVLLVTVVPLLLFSFVAAGLGLMVAALAPGSLGATGWSALVSLWPVAVGVAGAAAIGSVAALIVPRATAVDHLHGA
ncbi:FtsX-like permease family protein [Georgenia sp. Z1344]|uniref:FtsX-like permease family protein n=1 Tax=Georgenia sp. Z1344 TaxID=3416706 RepID=UPI003CEB135E